MKRRGRQNCAASRLIERLEDRLFLAGDDTLVNANIVPLTPGVPAQVADSVDPDDDVDLYKVTLAFGDTLTADLDAFTAGSGLDSLLRVFDSNGIQVASNDDDGSTTDSLASFTALRAGEYYVGVSTFINFDYNPKVADSGFGAGFTGEYTLNLLRTPLADVGDTLNNAADVTLTGNVPAIEIGIIDPTDDVDLYRVNLAGGQILRIDIEAVTLDHGPSDPILDSYVRIFDATGNELDFNDDDGSTTDSLLTFTATTDGVYYVGISDAFNIGYDPTIAGSGAGNGFSTGNYIASFAIVPPAPQADGNDTLATATAVFFVRDQLTSVPGESLTHVIGLDRDVDLYGVSLVAGDTLHLEVAASSLGFSLEARLRLFDAAGNELASSVAMDGIDALLDFAVLTTGEYFVGISGAGNGAYDPNVENSGVASSTGPYRLQVQVLSAAAVTTEIEPNNTIGTPNVIAVDTSVAGNIGVTGDVDYFMFTIGSSGRLTAQVQAAAGSPLDARLTLYNSRFEPYSTSDDRTIDDLDPLIVQHLTPGTYFLKVDSAAPSAAAGAATGAYQLSTELVHVTSPFQPHDTQNVLLGGVPSGIAAGDFNGDGIEDLVSADLTGSVSVLLGLGDLSYRPAMSLAVGTAVVALATGHFNVDDNLDLAVVDAGSGDVTILLGVGDGTFMPQSPIDVGDNPQAIAIGTFNNDQLPDLVVANAGDGTVTLLLGQGNGSFVVGGVFQVGESPEGVVVADFNGDTRPDVATANRLSNNVSILLNNGQGGFQVQQPLAVGMEPTSLTVANFNDDAFLDLAVANTGSDDVSLLLGQGGGTFLPQRRFDIRDAAESDISNSRSFVAAADFNHDGIADLVVGNAFDSRISVALGTGNADDLFARRQNFSSDIRSRPWNVVVGDFNGDGRMDFATADRTANHISVFGGLDDGTFYSGARNDVGNSPLGLVVGDVNHDGRPDLITSNTDDTSVLLGRGDGSFDDQLRAAAGSPNAVAIGDFNRDGLRDLVTVNFFTGPGGQPVFNQIVILLGLGDGTYLARPPIDIGSFLSAVVADDFNGDGRLDLAVASFFDNAVIVLLGDGNGNFNPQAPLAVDLRPQALVVGDFNNDGIKDLATANQAAASVSILVGNDNGSFQAAVTLDVGDLPYGLTVGDLSGDGVDDLAVTNSADGTVTILLGATDGDFAAANINRITLKVGDKDDVQPAQPRGIIAGDFNADGLLDLAVTNYGQHKVSVLLANAGAGGQPNGTFTQSLVSVSSALNLGRGPSAIVAADFNNDGRLDIATANSDSDNVSVLLGLGGGRFNPPGQPLASAANAAPLLTDLNGDGAADSVIMDRAGNLLLRLGRPNEPGGFDAPLVVNPNRPAADFALLRDGANRQLVVLERGALNSNGNFVSRITIYRFDSQGAPQVVSRRTLPESVQLDRVIATNVDADGRDDLVGIDSANQRLTIFNRLDKSFDFANPTHVELSGSPAALLAANLDGGGVDFLVTDQISGTINAVLDAAGAATSVLGYRTNTSPTGVELPDGAVPGQPGPPLVFDGLTTIATGDFNRDGHRDAVVAHRGTNALGILLGSGKGGFVNATQILVGSRPADVRVADFNGDLNPDLAVLNQGSSNVEVFLGDGQGNFALKGRFDAGNAPAGLMIADVNGDGELDLAVGNDLGDVLILQGNGDGSFESFTRINRNMAIAVGDLDGDGRDDWVVTNETSDRVAIQQADNTPVFNRNEGVTAPAAVKLALLNDDDFLDMVVVNSGGNNVLVYLGAGNGQFGNPTSFHAGTNPIDALVDDVNGDGSLDVVVTNFGANSVRVLFGNGDGTLQAGLLIDNVGLGGPVSTQFDDFDGDGRKDLLVTNSTSNQVVMLAGLASGFFDQQNPTVFNTGSRPMQTLVGNFDGAPGLDFVTVNYGSNNLSFYSGFNALARRDVSSGGMNPLTAVASDFNSDGTMDLLVGNNGNGVFSVFTGGQTGLSLTNSFSDAAIPHPAALALSEFGQGQELQLLALSEGDELIHVFNRETLVGAEPGGGSLNPGSFVSGLFGQSGSLFAGLFGTSSLGFNLLFSLTAAVGFSLNSLLEGFDIGGGSDGGGDDTRPFALEFFETLGSAITSGKELLESALGGLTTTLGLEVDDQELKQAVEEVISVLFPHVPWQALPSLVNGLLERSAQLVKPSPQAVDQVLETTSNDDWAAPGASELLEMLSPRAVDMALLIATASGLVFDAPLPDASAVAPADNQSNHQADDAALYGMKLETVINYDHRRSYGLAAVMGALGAGGYIYRLRRRDKHFGGCRV